MKLDFFTINGSILGNCFRINFTKHVQHKQYLVTARNTEHTENRKKNSISWNAVNINLICTFIHVRVTDTNACE